VDAAGKEQKLKSWKFVAGTRHLGWLAPAAAPREQKPGEKPQPAEAGPMAVEFRDENSTTLVDGVLTFLVPEYLKELEYDNEKEAVTARVFLSEEAALKLTGSTKYMGINKVTIEAEVDK